MNNPNQPTFPSGFPENIKEILESVIFKKLPEELKSTKELLPIFYVGKVGGNLAVVGTPFHGNTEDEATMAKEMAAKAVELIAKKEGAEFIIFVSEEWSVKPEDQEDFFKGRKEGRWRYISEYPKKIEVVFVQVETETKMFMGGTEISKDRTLVSEIKMSASEVSGRFANLLGKKPHLH